MPDIVVSITETQMKGLRYAAVDPQHWCENVITERARVANDKIVEIAVQHCLDNGVQIPATREAIVSYAFDNALVQTAADAQAAIDAEVAEMVAAEEPAE